MANYKPPHGILDSLFTWSSHGMDQNQKENDAYDAGWHHQRGVEDAQAGNYKPPHDTLDELFTWSSHGMDQNRKDNDAYNRGWHSGRGRADAKSK